jgi:hypothetical protein
VRDCEITVTPAIVPMLAKAMLRPVRRWAMLVVSIELCRFGFELSCLRKSNKANVVECYKKMSKGE